MDSFTLGNVAEVRGEFRVDDVLTDPTDVFFDLVQPGSMIQTYQYGVDAEVVKGSVGVYLFEFEPVVQGLHRYRWRGTEVAHGADEGEFFVESQFLSPVQYSYDLATAVGKVRLYIDDRDLSQVSASVPYEKRSAIFADAEIEQFLAASSNEPLYAAALALITISNNRNLMVQRRVLSRTTVDFGSLRGDLLRQAEALRKQAAEMGLGPMAPADGIVEMIYDDFGLRRVITNASLRTEGLSTL